MYLVFTRMPGESYRRRLRSLLLYLCYVFRVLINSLVCSLIFLLKSFLFNFLVETLQAVKYANNFVVTIQVVLILTSFYTVP